MNDDRAKHLEPLRSLHDHWVAEEDPATASPARTAGLEPGDATQQPTPESTQQPARKITGELDHAVDAPDHNVTRDDAEAALPVRGR